MEHKFKDGCMWEGGGFSINTDYECSEMCGGEMCKHCHSKETKVHIRSDKTTYDEVVWICPKVVIALNEGGYNSTGVCLDCIVEAAQSLGALNGS
jgi:hypothetical protein